MSAQDMPQAGGDLEAELAIVRRAYAKHVLTNAADARVEAAFATGASRSVPGAGAEVNNPAHVSLCDNAGRRPGLSLPGRVRRPRTGPLAEQRPAVRLRNADGARGAAAGRARRTRRRWGCRRPEAAQITKNERRRSDREEARVAGGTTSTQKTVHLAYVQITCTEALVPKPTAQMGQQPHLRVG
jgi:hypothetical protein